jgi:hypothetical protein
MAKSETATSTRNHVKSDVMTITIKHDKTFQVAYKKNGNPNNKLPKIGDRHPDNNRPIEAEEGTEKAETIGYIKWHHHNPDCITVEIGGAQYQICF